ncbi:MAG: hypothetical protein ACOQNY_00300 [Mycoplasmoidaceae bacterium]
MNFPAQGLAIIGPILFIVLMIAFPVIGVFGGWKRAAYWGGGNLVFYLLGLGIWAGAHAALGNAMLGWLSSVIPDFPADKLKDFASSITAPIFFLIVVVAGNLFLLLNYYFWFKRVAKIRRKDDQANLDNNTLPSKKYRIISMVAGGVGMPVLMLPTTLSATQAAMFVTTSAATRKNNAFANGLYNGLAKLSESFGGLSYYGITKSAEDFDALWAAQGLTKTLDEPIPSPSGGTPLTGTVQEVMGQVFQDGIGNIVTKVTTPGTKEETETNVANSINGLTGSWNAIIEAAGSTLIPLFESESFTKVIKDVFGDYPTSEITKDEINNYFGEGKIFDVVYTAYIENGEIQGIPFDDINQVSVSTKCIDNIQDALETFYTFSADVTSDEQTLFTSKVRLIIELMFKAK